MGDHDGAIPVDRDKGPGEGTRDDRSVNEAGVGVVAEVERAQVEEVDDENELSPAKVRADEEHDKGEVEEVVGDEVRADAGSSIDMVGVRGEEVSDVAGLEDEEDDPVDVGKYGVDGESCRVEVVLVPDTLADGVAIGGRVDVVVDGDDDGKEPGEEGQDLVGGDGGSAVRLAPGEGVVWGCKVSFEQDEGEALSRE